jgi:DNA primase
MEVLNDYPWSICRKEEGMAIRGLDSRKVDSTSYTPAHVKSVIKSLGLNIVGETGNDFLCYCPFHSNRHTSSFSVSREKGAYICFNPSCGEAGTLVELVKKILSKNEFESLRYISSKESESVENFDEVLQDIFEDKPDYVEFPQETLDQLYNNLGANEHAKEYFKHRGINEESMNYFKLGYSSNMGMVIVPVHSPDGMPVGLVGRSISEKKFKNSTNLPRSKTMFNIHRAKRIGGQVIIVESTFDAIRVHQAGFPNVVATLGGHISHDNISLLNRYFNRIILMTDSDQAGRELGMTIASRMRNKDILWASHSYGKIYPNNAKDAGDMTDEEISACIKNAVSDIEYRTWNS